MECWLYDVADAHRDRFQPRDEGALWLTFLGSDGTLVSAAVEGATEHVDERMLSSLTTVIDGAGAESVVLVVPRSNARPRPVDRRLWQELRSRADPRTEIVDLLVVGARGFTSLSDELSAMDGIGE